MFKKLLNNKNKYKSNYIIQNPVGNVFYIEGITEGARKRLPNKEVEKVAVVTGGLVLWYDFTETPQVESRGIVKDKSSKGNDGTLYNFNYTTGSGWIEEGLRFDGTNDYIDISSVVNEFPIQNTPYTLEAYIKINVGVTDQRDIIDIGGYTNGSNVFRLTYYLREINNQKWRNATMYNTSSNYTPDNNFIHVMGTYDGIESKLYFNGELVKETTGGGWKRDKIATIGIQKTSNVHAFPGVMKDVLV